MRTGTTRARRGFTIIELLLVVVMIGLLGAISMGKTSGIMTSWRVNRAAQAMAEEFQVGFALVGRNRKPVIMEFKTDSMNLVIRSRPDLNGTTTVFRRRHFGKDSEYKLSASNLVFSNNTNSIEVYPPGLAADSFGVTISKLSAGRRVRLMRGGLTQICVSTDPTKC
jgi:prepilin-type N-terminal cleavage/methylation domain-containing protein